MGFLNASNTAGFLIVGLVAGAWIDRWRKRRVMLVADLVRFTALGAIPVLFVLGALTMSSVIVVALVVGVATVFFDIAYQSFVPLVVKSEEIGPANSLLEISAQTAGLGGPTAAGLLLSVVSAPVVFVIDAVSFFASAISLWRIRDPETQLERDANGDRIARRSLGREIVEGLRFVWRQPFIRAISFTTATSNFFSAIIFTLFPLLILRTLGMSIAEMGVLESVGAAGGLCGAVLATRIVDRIGEGLTIAVSSLLGGVSSFLIPISVMGGDTVRFVLLAISFFAFGFTVLTYNITQVSARQRLCPPQLLGRMNASIRFLVWGVMPIAAILGGLAARAIGVVPTFWICATGGLLASAFVIVSPLSRLRFIGGAERPE